jgi:hypothetical protein
MRRYSADASGELPAPFSSSTEDMPLIGDELQSAAAPDALHPLLRDPPPGPASTSRTAAGAAATLRSATGLGLEGRAKERLGGTGSRGSIMLARMHAEPLRK